MPYFRTAVCLAAILVVAGCQSSTPPESPTAVAGDAGMVISAYREPMTIQGLVASSAVVFTGEVTEHGQTVAQNVNGVDLEWTPVVLSVTETLKGENVPTPATVKAAADSRLAPELESLAVGTNVVVFTDPPVALSDGSSLYMTNGVAVVGAGGTLTPAFTMDEETLEGALRDVRVALGS